jgi:hypothetical protein
MTRFQSGASSLNWGIRHASNGFGFTTDAHGWTQMDFSFRGHLCSFAALGLELLARQKRQTWDETVLLARGGIA